jgi:GNAT superfamily N-acetyltransferase
MSEVSLRRMTASDLAAADELRRLVGWNQTPQDWQAMLELAPNGCFVALKGTQLVGTVTTIRYGRPLGWIGMMLVHPEHRRQGIAARLMAEALKHMHGLSIPCAGLDATPAGLPVYEKMGFVAEWTLTRWQRSTAPESAAAPNHGMAVRAAVEADRPALVELDAGAFGVPRPQLIRSLVHRSVAALVWPARGQPVGWGLLRPGANALYLGPIACSRSAGALILAEALLARASSQAVFWDIPDENSIARGAAQSSGFAPVRPLTRMYLGQRSFSSDPRAQFAIADPAVG